MFLPEQIIVRLKDNLALIGIISSILACFVIVFGLITQRYIFVILGVAKLVVLLMCVPLICQLREWLNRTKEVK